MSIFDSIKNFFGGSAANGDGHGAMDEADMIPCEEALRLVHDYLDGELDGVPAMKVKRHFDACGRCYPHLRLETAYREAVRRAASGQEAPPGLKSRIAKLLAEDQAEG